jgi:uncharacterized protein YggU (UPF0235/DUF167 family)
MARVIPRAGATRIAGVRDNQLLIRIAAAPVDNAANLAVVSFLSDLLHVPSRDISVVSGERSRTKRILVRGATVERVVRVLNAILPASARG